MTHQGSTLHQGKQECINEKNKIDVIFKVHEEDQFSTDETTIVFDPWRTHPKEKNVVHYGDTKNV